MTFRHYDKLPSQRDQCPRSLESSLQQRVLAKKFDVLFWQPVASQFFDEGTESDSVATRKYDGAAIVRGAGIEVFVMHAKLRSAIQRPRLAMGGRAEMAYNKM
jgi:hypothetical protein